jgi:hypothetical protein
LGCWSGRSACSSKQRRTAIGELRAGTALTPPNPAQRNGAFDTGKEFPATAASLQKRFIDALNEDAAILFRSDAVRDLSDLAGGSKGIGKRVTLDELHAVLDIPY